MLPIRMRIASVARNDSGNRQPAIGAVVERPLEELHAVREVRVRLHQHHEPRQRRDALGPHRIALVRHRRRPDLLRLERLFHLAERLEHAKVAAELRRAGGDAGDDAENLRVELPRVGLTGDGNRRPKSDLLGDHSLELADLLVVAAEDLEEARLRARRSLDATTGQRRDAHVDVGEIEHQILHPQRRALADGRRLGGLKVRGAQGRLIGPRLRELGEAAQYVDDPAAEDRHALTHEDEVRVVGDERARRAVVDELLRFRARRRRTHGCAPSRRAGSASRTPPRRRSRCRRDALASRQSRRRGCRRPARRSPSANASHSRRH